MSNDRVTAARKPLRVRHEPPALDEAIAAAQDITQDREQQVEIAAALMGMPPEEVRPAVLRTFAEKKRIVRIGTGPSRGGGSFVVERRSRAIVRR